MKATGIIRRIDDLGRIVIPKEIRKSLRIREGETVEIFVENETIVLKKNSMIKKINDYAQNICYAINEIYKKNIFITDSDIIIAAAGSKRKELMNKEISTTLRNKIKRRENILEKYLKEIEVINGNTIETAYTVSPIVINGDSLGLVVIIDESVDELEFKAVKTAANIIQTNLE